MRLAALAAAPAACILCLNLCLSLCVCCCRCACLSLCCVLLHVQLFHSLKSHAPGDTEWDDLVAFLQEFCSLAKHLQLQHRQNLWNKMTQLGMFEVQPSSRVGAGVVWFGLGRGCSTVCGSQAAGQTAPVGQGAQLHASPLQRIALCVVCMPFLSPTLVSACLNCHRFAVPCCVPLLQVITRILQSSTPAVKLRATDILLSALAHDPMPLRNFLAAPNGRHLLNSLVVEFVSSDESGLPEQIAELLKMLVDPGGLGGGCVQCGCMECLAAATARGGWWI